MQLLRLLTLLPLAASASDFEVRGDESGGVVEPTKQFIIEVNSIADLEAVSQKFTKGRSARVLKTFNSDVFTGLAIETDDDNLDTINQAVGVAQVWTASLVHIPEFETLSTRSLLGDAANYSSYVHQYTGVAKHHAEGNLGQGIKIAVIDSGIDYSHEAFGSGYGPGYTVAGGWDLVGDSWAALDLNLAPDDDPMDITGHGSHVAGIISGKSDWFTGVAPEAELYAYKVFGTRGSTYDFILIDAFIRAYEDGVDVITASIGGALGGGWSNGAWATIASRIVENGVIVTIAAGNSGNTGPFYANSGSSGKGVVAVASASNNVIIPRNTFELSIAVDGATSRTKQASVGWSPWDYIDVPIVPLFQDYDIQRQACQASNLPADIANLSGKIVVIRRSDCTYDDVAHTIIPYNPLAILIISNGGRAVHPASRPSWPMALIEESVGRAILEAAAAGATITGDFAKYQGEFITIGIENPPAYPADSTQWGGLHNLDNKPDIAAPGVEILSVANGGGWRISSGTSMATPYVAGIAALFLHANGGRAVNGNGIAADFYTRVIASGKTMPWSTADQPLEPVPDLWSPTIQTGAGQIDAWKITNSTTRLSTARFLLNDTANFQGEQTVEITNTANVDAVYTFKLQPAGGIYAGNANGKGLMQLPGLRPTIMVPDFAAPSGTFTVRAGETKTARFTFDYPRGLDIARQPFYSGKVLVESSVQESLSIIYFGAAYDLKAHYKQIFSVKPTLSRSSSAFNLPALDYPTMFLSFDWGCDEVRFDIYGPSFQESHAAYPPVVGDNGYVGSGTAWRHSTYLDRWTSPYDKEDTVSFPLRAFSRDWFRSVALGYTFTRIMWFGKLADGTYISPGTYTVRLAALRPFGIREVADDWEVVLLPFTFLA